MEVEEKINCGIEYSSALFDEATIERMSGHFKTLATAIVENPDRRIDELPLMRHEQRQDVSALSCSDTRLVRGDLGHRFVEVQAEKTREAAAVISEEAVLTYVELNARANRIALRLSELGAGPEVPVAICMARSLDLVTAVLG